MPQVKGSVPRGCPTSDAGLKEQVMYGVSPAIDDSKNSGTLTYIYWFIKGNDKGYR